MGRTTVNRRDPEVLRMRKTLLVFLCAMSPLTQAKIVDLDCVYENLHGVDAKKNITIDLGKKTFKGGNDLFKPHQVEITDEFVSAQKQKVGGEVTVIKTHQISRVTLSYVFVYEISGIGKNRFEGQCEIVTRKRVF